jgi:hypothetical protein
MKLHFLGHDCPFGWIQSTGGDRFLMALYSFRFKHVKIPGLEVRARTTRQKKHATRAMWSLLHVDAPCLLRQQFTSFDKYKSWLGKVDPSKCTACTIVEAYGHRLPELVQRIKASHVSKVDQKRAPADVILSSVHKAKGLGFPSVFMCDDLLSQSISPLIAALSVQNSPYVSDIRKLLAQTGVDVDEEVRLGDGRGRLRSAGPP